MKALIYKGPGQKAVEDRPKPTIQLPTDAIVKITKTTICGTDLHILKCDVATCKPGTVLGHESFGVVDSVGLAITRSIILAHGGEIAVRSGDAGVCFELRLG